MKGIIKELEEYGVEVVGFDPLLDADDLQEEFNIKLFRNLEEVKKVRMDCIIITVAHSAFCKLSLNDFEEMQNKDCILIDVRGIFNAEEASKARFHYKTL